MNCYRNIKDRQTKEFNDFAKKYMFFAFNDEQFNAGLMKFNITPGKDALVKLKATPGRGYILANKADEFEELIRSHNKEIEDGITGDGTGEGFISDMFEYELHNHEYGYTRNEVPALMALGITAERLIDDPKLIHGLTVAKRRVIEQSGE